MNLTVTQDNLYLFLPSKVSWMAEMLAEDENIDIVEAVSKIYNSDKLGSRALYGIFNLDIC